MVHDGNLTDAVWAIVEPQLPAVLPGGRRRPTDVRAVVNARSVASLRDGCDRSMGTQDASNQKVAA
jgi:transposase